MSPLYSGEYPLERKLVCALIAHNQMQMRVIKLSRDEIILEKSMGLFAESCFLTIDLNRNWIQAANLDKTTHKIVLDDFKAVCNQCAESLTQEQVDYAYQDLMREVPVMNGALLEQKPISKKEKFLTLFDAFIPQAGNWVTPSIILLNTIYFLWMISRGVNFFTPSGEDIIDYGGNVKDYIAGGEWWRLITCTFVHVGFVHLFFNMISLYSIGRAVESYIKPLPYAMIYLSCGICGSLLSALYLDHSISAGASGAIFGMYGFLFALFTTNLFPVGSKKEILVGIGSIIGVNLFMGLSPRIDNAGHIGGLVMGIVVGYIAYLFLRKSKDTLWVGIISLVLALICAVFVLRKIIGN